MRTKLLSSEGIERGRVIVMEDGKLVADGLLADLQIVDDGNEPDVAEVYVNPADADFARAWLLCGGKA